MYEGRERVSSGDVSTSIVDGIASGTWLSSAWISTVCILQAICYGVILFGQQWHNEAFLLKLILKTCYSPEKQQQQQNCANYRTLAFNQVMENDNIASVCSSPH